MLKNKLLKLISCIMLAVLLSISLTACNLKQIFCLHDFSETIVAATCKDEGSTTKTCKKCGYVRVSSLEKIPHSFESAWIESVAPTCEKVGKSERNCTVCGYKDEKPIPTKDHEIQAGELTSPTCTERGYTLGICKSCGKEEKGNFTNALGHDWENWVEITPASAEKDGEMQRKCLRCAKTETKTIAFYGHVNDSTLSFDFNASETPTVKDVNELQNFYKAVIFNRAKEATCTIDGFEVNNEVLNSLSFKDTPFEYSCNISASSNQLTIYAEYAKLPSKTTQAQTRQSQLASLNHYNPEKKRQDNFDGFKINSAKKSYNVTYTDQLCYVLERGYKPVPTSGSAAERIYEKIKAVLREIINDDMTDFQKVRAIHDYLVINVVYDNVLYSLASNTADIKQYNGFYLEGVFEDKIAVCDGISKAFSAMANIEGIPCVQITGKANGETGNIGHAWNKVLINNNWYIVDATSDNVIVNNEYEILSLEYFLITDEKMSGSYIAHNYTDLKATKDYLNRYSDTNNIFDFIVDSDLELAGIISNTKNKSATGGSVQFTIGNDYTDGNLKAKIAAMSLLYNISYIQNCGGTGVYTYKVC